MGRLKWQLSVLSRTRYRDIGIKMRCGLKIPCTIACKNCWPRHQPVIPVKLHRFKWVGRDCMACGGAALFTALIYLDTVCYCGLSFDLIGRISS